MTTTGTTVRGYPRTALGLPVLATTTIGSFPQATQIRTARADLVAGRIDAATYDGLMREEIADLDAAGIGVIQVDEPALRELLPLRAADRPAYLDWAVGSFWLATAVARDATQIHTHLCYSEFGDVIGAIDALDADVTTIEAARSAMEVLGDLRDAGFSRQVGPGVYDIHSPRVPSTAEMVRLLEAAVAAVPAGRIWVNPDCGLKTRAYEQVVPALRQMVAAAHTVRTAVPVA